MHSLILDGPNNNYVGFILLFLVLAFVVPIVMLIIGIAIRSKNKKTSNILFIIITVYDLIGLGFCGSLMF